jgi:hypothetical protein
MENLSMLFRTLFRRNSGLPVALTLGAVLALLFAWSGCGKVECGKGTVEVDGVCQVANMLECAAGFKAQGDKCVPEDEWVTHYCGENAAYDKASGTCIGIGGGGAALTCKKVCPAVSGSKICLQGQVFHAPAVIGYWAGDNDLGDLQNPENGHLVTTNKDGAIVKIYDPIDFVTDPSSAQPLWEGPIEDDGCFTAENVAIPFSNLFAVGVDDELATGTSWALCALGVIPTVGQNSTNLVVPAATEDLAKKWDSGGYNFYTAGSMFAVYLNKFTKKGVEGVVPTFDGNPPTGPGADGSWQFPTSDTMDVFYMAADLSDLTNIVDKSASATNKNGIAIIRKMAVQNLWGEKAGCTIAGGKSKLGGSSPGTLFFSIFDVEGC